MPRLRKRGHQQRESELVFMSRTWWKVRLYPRAQWKAWVIAEFERGLRRRGLMATLERWQQKRARGLVRWADRCQE